MHYRRLGPVQVAEQKMGPALGRVKQRSWLAILVIVRLVELRLAAVEERIEVDLANGRCGGVVGGLEVIVVGHALRGRVRAPLMLGLYRSGRQGAGLHRSRGARRELAEELGLEPRFERAIMLGAIGTRFAAAPPAPTVLVRRGTGQAGLAPDDPGTRLRWSLTGLGS